MRELGVIGGPLRVIARCRDWRRPVLSAALGVAWLTVALVGVPAGDAAPADTAAGSASAAGLPTIGGCQVFPADNVWNARIDGLPVHARSDAWIGSVGRSTGLKADFGSGLWEGYPIGIPYTTAPGSQPAVSISFYYDDDSDTGAYRIPPDAPIEGGGDHHVLVVDRDRCILTEVYDATKLSNTAWEAGSGAFFDLRSNALRPDTLTSADAAGLPILPGLARYDEVAAGEIAHALRFTAVRTQGTYIWPARHEASSITDPNVPPMGARVRLKSSVNVSTYPAELRVILTALQRYGMFLADNGSNWYISGAPDSRWNNDTLQQLRQVTGSMLEFVDESSLMVDPNSAQVRSGAPTPATPTSTTTPVTSCSPRPANQVSLARGAAGRMNVTVTAGVGESAPNNRLRALRFGTPTNARIWMGNQAVAAGTRWMLPNGATSATFTIERIQAGAGATVPLVVEDGCGDWSTFAGGGPGAF
jgi:hypothetical protein